MPIPGLTEMPLKVGVVALQGDYAAHADALRSSDTEIVLVRATEELADLNGLVIPGGESTALLKLLTRENMFEAVREFAMAKPVFGTCAGCIILAKEVLPSPQRSLAVLDIVVQRNVMDDRSNPVLLWKIAPSPVDGSKWSSFARRVS